MFAKLLTDLLTDATTIQGDKVATYYKLRLPHVTLLEEDAEMIKRAITLNYLPQEGRSVTVNLSRNYKSAAFPFDADCAQLKGVKFSSNIALEKYYGIGVCPLYYYSDSKGRLLEIRNIEDTVIIQGSRVGKEAKGAMDYEEAVKEFYFTEQIYNLKLAGISTKVPYAVGRYEGIVFDNGSLGFEVLLTNRAVLDRTKDYLACVTAKDSNKFKEIIFRRARDLRTLHTNGYLVPFMTLDNYQILCNKPLAILHDIGDSRFLNRKMNAVSDDQFASESFWNLFYILQANRAILPGAQGFEDSMLYIEKHFDDFYSATVSGYFGDENFCNRHRYNDFKNTFDSLVSGSGRNTALFKECFI